MDTLATACPKVGPDDGLGHPDGLPLRGIDGGSVDVVEEGGGVAEAVPLVVLVVRVYVSADPVDLLDDGAVAAVCDRAPRVDVTDRLVTEYGALDGGAEVLDEVDDRAGALSQSRFVLYALFREPVEVLAAHGDTNNEVRKFLAILIDGILYRSQLIFDRLGAGAPYPEQHRGVGRNGCRES